MQIVVDVELIKAKYLDFKKKEKTELEKAETVARDSAAKLNWNEISTQQMIDYVVGKAKEQLATEKTFWDSVVREEEDPVVELDSAELPMNDIPEEL